MSLFHKAAGCRPATSCEFCEISKARLFHRTPLILGQQFQREEFNLPTRAFNLATRAFSLLTRGFELVTCGFELVTSGFELVTREFELVTRVLLFHPQKSVKIKI